MSTYYGRVSGSAKTEATRGGTASSGISSTAETWKAVIRSAIQTTDRTPSKCEAHVRLSGKYGGIVLSLDFDPDTLAKHGDDPRLRSALEDVERAMARADGLAMLIEEEGK